MTSGAKCVAAIKAWIKSKGRRPSWEELEVIINQALPRSKRTPSGFIPPTPDEVAAYGREIGYPLDGEDFCDAYEKKDWKISGSIRMSSWKAAVRQWKKHNWGILLRGDGSSALSEIPGWRFYLKERQAQGLFPRNIPDSWEELERQDKVAIISQQKYIRNLAELAEKNPGWFTERVKRLEEEVA